MVAGVKGHVPTPPAVVDAMVEKLFRVRPPKATDVILDPGTGDGPFIAGILRYCAARGLPPPNVIGIDSDLRLIEAARDQFRAHPTVSLLHQDYLASPAVPADFIIGNPPYVSITGLDEREKARYRAAFETAVGRFDLYLLFFERSIQNLRPGGRLVFITPEKFEYVHTAHALRTLLSQMTVEEIDHIDEATFPGLVTYPTITTLEKTRPETDHQVQVRLRSGETVRAILPRDGHSWNGAFRSHGQPSGTSTLQDLAVRVSCGVATGADEVFVLPQADVPEALSRFAYPTIAGRQLGSEPFTTGADVASTRDAMLVPYDKEGRLLPEAQLGPMRDYLVQHGRAAQLRQRTCVTKGGRAWYRFHDSVPLPEMLRPKILCKDITREPGFWLEKHGSLVPRHSVYYIVPKPGVDMVSLRDYLNSPAASEWLRAHCQRAANGFFRLQSQVLRRMPIPDRLAGPMRRSRRLEVPVQRKATRARWLHEYD